MIYILYQSIDNILIVHFAILILHFIHRRMNTLLEKVLKSVKDHRSVPRKPAILPISSLTEMDDFENIDEDRYTDVVSEKET